jgi:hypothetical protein
VYYKTITDDEAEQLKLRRDVEGWFTRSTKIQAAVDAHVKSREVFLPSNVMKNIREFCGEPLPADKWEIDTVTRERKHTRYFRDPQAVTRHSGYLALWPGFVNPVVAPVLYK